MKKKIKKVGTSLGLYFTKEETQIYDLEVGDIVEIEINKVH